tara:strand:+ start:442 stop:1404 length:963 start_codon:yes stop_codon:yes gene_type:complete
MNKINKFKLNEIYTDLKLPKNTRRDRVTDIDYIGFYEILKNTNELIDKLGGLASVHNIANYLYENRKRIMLKERIISLRIFSGLTIDEAAKAIDVTALTYKKYENECFKDGLSERQVTNLINASYGRVKGIKTLPNTKYWEDLDEEFENVFPSWRKYMEVYLGDPSFIIKEEDEPFDDDVQDWFNENGFHHIWAFCIKINDSKVNEKQAWSNIQNDLIKLLKPVDTRENMTKAIKNYNNYQNNYLAKLTNQNEFFDEIQKMLSLDYYDKFYEEEFSDDKNLVNKEFFDTRKNRYEYISFLLYFSNKKLINKNNWDPYLYK